MKNRTAYYITAHSFNAEHKGDFGRINNDRSQYLLPNELHLIKSMLNDGVVITGVRKDTLTEKEFKYYFG